jgi:hypothetical protein
MNVGEARALLGLLELVHQQRVAHCGGAPAGIVSSTHTVKRRSSPGCGGMFVLDSIKLKMRGGGGLGEGVCILYEKINRTIGDLRYAATFINEGSNGRRL